MKLLLSLSEAARRLGISRSTTLKQLIASGALYTVKVNQRVRIPAQEINRLCQTGFDTSIPLRKMRVLRLQSAANVDKQVEELRNTKLF